MPSHIAADEATNALLEDLARDSIARCLPLSVARAVAANAWLLIHDRESSVQALVGNQDLLTEERLYPDVVLATASPRTVAHLCQVGADLLEADIGSRDSAGPVVLRNMARALWKREQPEPSDADSFLGLMFAPNPEGDVIREIAKSDGAVVVYCPEFAESSIAVSALVHILQESDRQITLYERSDSGSMHLQKVGATVISTGVPLSTAIKIAADTVLLPTTNIFARAPWQAVDTLSLGLRVSGALAGELAELMNAPE